jgi:hypothetical protein
MGRVEEKGLMKQRGGIKVGLLVALIFLAGFALAWIVIERPPLSAAATIRCTLAALAVGPLVLGGAGVLLTQWWARRKQRQRYEDAIRQAEVYERLQGSSGQPRSRSRRRSSERDREHGDTIRIVLGDRTNQRMSRERWRCTSR